MKMSTDEWLAVIEGQRSSGLSQREFCASQGLALSTFQLWKRKIGGKSGAIELRRPQFVELDLGPNMLVSPPHDDLVVELPHGVIMRFRHVTR